MTGGYCSIVYYHYFIAPATALSWINASYNRFFLANASLPVMASRSNLSTFQYFYLSLYP